MRRFPGHPLLPSLLFALLLVLPCGASAHFWGASGGSPSEPGKGAPPPPASRPLVDLPAPRQMTVHLLADTSLKEAAADASVAFLAANPWARVVPRFAPAGEIAEALRRGDEADVVLLPDPSLAAQLAAEKRLMRDSVTTLGRFPLVFAGREGVRARRLSDLPALARVETADPARHPSGAMAAEALRNGGVAPEMEGRLHASAADAREALAAVARGEADGAFAFRPDLEATPAVRTLFVVPRGLHATPEAVAALTPAAGNYDGAIVFFRFLRSAEAKGILGRRGIEPCR